MRRYWCCVCLLGFTGAAVLVFVHGAGLRGGPYIQSPVTPGARSSLTSRIRNSRSFSRSVPVTFEANVGQADARVDFIGRGIGLSVLLTRDGIDVIGPRVAHNPRPSERTHIGLATDTGAAFSWSGEGRLQAETNYFLGNDPRRWRTHVPHFTRAVAANALPGVDLVAYGNEEGIEYDIRLAPGVDADKVGLQISGADAMRLDGAGNLLVQSGPNEIRMQKPRMYEEHPRGERRSVEGGYLLRPDGAVGFRAAAHDPGATLVIDPSLSVAYATFLGGTGEDSANSIAMDSSGNVYISGTTTSAASFAEAGVLIGPLGGASDFFIAKINPAMNGPSSLVYLTFLGGSGDEEGGLIAVDAKGDVAITGTTTSTDFPVTDSSKRTAGPNDVTVSELDPTGAKLILSTLFGGSGAEATQNSGGIALNSSGSIFIVSDTTSTDLPVTPGAFQTTYGGGASDGFLAELTPSTTPGASPTVTYCTYLGLNATVGVSGVAVDTDGNAYLVGFTSDPGTSFPAMNAFQSTYGGGDFDAFVMKIRPSGTGASDLSYATFLGGGDTDQALAVQIGNSLPGIAYVTGTTQSGNFPTNGTNAAFQTTLKGTVNAFLSVVAQNASTGMTSLTYSTYLGGSESDAGLSVAVTAANSVFIAGSATSPDFSFWQDNFQPFTGNQDAFVAKFDPTSPGSASLIYSTPLGGTAGPGVSATASGNAIAADGAGHVYVAGQTTAGDFPIAGSTSSGFQPNCVSCTMSPPASDAFFMEIAENAAEAPSVSFNAAKINFGAVAIGTQNSVPQPGAVVNTGDAPLVISGSPAITGPNNADFSFSDIGNCTDATLAPGKNCSFEISFAPSIVGTEQAFVSITDNSPNNLPGNTQALELTGVGNGPLAAVSPSSLDFGSAPQGSTTNGQTVTLTNTGNQPLVISNGPLIAGPDSAEFQPEGSSCSVTTPIAPGSSCAITIAFAPNAVRSFQAQLNFFDNAGNVATAEQVVPLTGTGTAAAPIARILPSALGFGTQAIGTTSGTQIATLTNTGSAALSITSIGITGTNTADFAIVTAGSSCPLTSGSVAIGASCTVAVDFAPQSGGAKTANLTFNDNASGSPQTVALSGTADALQIQLSAASLTFGAQSVGTTSAAQTITVSNPGTAALGFNSISATGANALDFNVANHCPPSLGVGGSCGITVTFKPTAAGNRTAAVSIADNAPGSPQTVALSGTATQPIVVLSPTSVNFASEVAGAKSAAVPITVTNAGTGVLVFSGKPSLAGAKPGDFGETDTCTGTNVTIAPNATCTIQVTFSPTALGARAASLVLTDNAPDSPQSVALSGTGMDFSIGAANGAPTSITVTAGQPANYQLEVTSSASGSVTISCSGAPPSGACQSETAAANTPFTLTATTMARSAIPRLRWPSTGDPRDEWRIGPGLAIAFAMLVMWIAITARRPRRGRALRLAQAGGIVILLAVVLAACGGGGSGNQGLGTPAGTYTLTVTAGQGGTAHSLNLTLVVQ
jgi:Abnormal spindle-like microcephaly-assoc'd, ASPM-SPD-2-Hydin/Beta-propeller repeat